MSSETDDRKVLVSGIRGLSEDDIVLFLESQRHCPKGGSVTDYVQISEDEAVVIFEDSKVANRLNEHLTLLNGAKILVEPYREYQKRIRSQTTSDKRQVSSENDSKHEHAGRISDACIEGSSQGNRIEASIANTDRCIKSQTTHKPINISKSVKPPPVLQKPKPKTVKTLKFSWEKLKLVKLVWDLESTLRSSCNCVVKFDEQTYGVTLEGAEDGVTAAGILLHEMANDSETQLVDITPQIQKLLSTAKGQNWLTQDLRDLGIPAVVYIRDGAVNLIAKNRDTLNFAGDIVKQLVSTKSISFNDCHRCFLQSPSWSQRVQAIEASGRISVHVNNTTSKVDLEGRASETDSCAVQIRELLKRNQTKTSSIKSMIGIVRLLQKQEHAINKEIQQNVSSPIQLEFCCQEGIVKVIGLSDDVSKAEQLISKKYIKSVCYGTHEINTPGLTNDMFRAKHGKQRDMIELLESRYKCVIEVRGGNHRPSESNPQQEASHSESQSTGIEVTLGNIVEFKADVLVNTVADESLEKGGIVLKQFLAAGAPKLQQDLLQKSKIPKIFGSDVVATHACGKLKAKFIFHAAIRQYQNQDSIEKLHNLIKKCLEMADQRNVSTIAFPTIGSGRLAFTPKDVVECFVRAKQTTKTTIKIFIVAFDDGTRDEFKSQLSSVLSEIVKNEAGNDSHRRDSPSTPVGNRVVFHINTSNEQDLRLVKVGLIERIKDMVDELTIKDDVIAVLDDVIVAKIRALETPDCTIDLDQKSGVIKIKGNRLKVLDIKGHISTTIVSQRAMDHYPSYWTNFKVTDDPSLKVGLKRARMNPSSSWYAEISQLVMTTWEQQKVGVGRDARGLAQHAIKIRNIFCIENPALLDRYMAKRKQLSNEASTHKFYPVKGLRNEQKITTMNLGLGHLYGTLSKDVNEVFLVHGTKKEIVDQIAMDGLDSRICGDETLFGVGSYFAESSTKADQYTDPMDKRVALGQPLHMFVCRVLLGDPYVCDDPANVKGFKRPPCKKRNCHQDKCSHLPVGHYHSIIGTHRPDPQQNGRLQFREFVVFLPDQSYPDFLIEYERIKCP